MPTQPSQRSLLEIIRLDVFVLSDIQNKLKNQIPKDDADCGHSRRLTASRNIRSLNDQAFSPSSTALSRRWLATEASAISSACPPARSLDQAAAGSSGSVKNTPDMRSTPHGRALTTERFLKGLKSVRFHSLRITFLDPIQSSKHTAQGGQLGPLSKSALRYQNFHYAFVNKLFSRHLIVSSSLTSACKRWRQGVCSWLRFERSLHVP